jgi:hypothetical protein
MLLLTVHEATTGQFRSVSDGWDTIACICRKVATVEKYWKFYWNSDHPFYPTRFPITIYELEARVGIERGI